MPEAALRECVIQLRCAPLPSLLRYVALHYWFVSYDPLAERWERWEVWQSRNAGGTSWGHVHRDLMAVHRGVGGGPSRVAAEWRGQEAQRIAEILHRPAAYPYGERYLAWPGPNSNTFVAWVLHHAAVEFDFDPRGVGKDFFVGPYGIGAVSAAHAGTRWETPFVGLRVHRRHGLELHLFGATFGLSLWPVRLKTPLGSAAFTARWRRKSTLPSVRDSD